LNEALTVRVAKRGTITLPKNLRDRYDIQVGDGLTLLDLGGTFVLTRERSQIDAIADRIGQALSEQGESLESMLQVLREERDRAFTDQYPEA
jgi:bifunctional DNA-binding transcriptional regulator/antitoxin component of YhaV-PrlF toxin-antitoxin module